MTYRRFRTKSPEIFIWVSGIQTEFGDEIWHAYLGPTMEGGMRDDNQAVTGMGFNRSEAFQSLRKQINTVLKWHNYGCN